MASTPSVIMVEKDLVYHYNGLALKDVSLDDGLFIQVDDRIGLTLEDANLAIEFLNTKKLTDSDSDSNNNGAPVELIVL